MFKVDKWTSLKKILGPVLLELLVLFVIFMQRHQVDFLAIHQGKQSNVSFKLKLLFQIVFKKVSILVTASVWLLQNIFWREKYSKVLSVALDYCACHL